jgi:long-chain acyl-CoA synthetase
MAITPADVEAKIAEITGPGGFFELEDYAIGDCSYPIYKYGPKTATEVLQNSRAHGDLDFIVYEGRRYTYTDFFAKVDALAAALQSRFGIAHGDRVAIAMRNNPEWAIAFAAALLCGAVVVPINSWGKTEELQYAITDSRASLLIADQSRFALIEQHFAGLGLPAIVVPEKEGFSPPPGATRFAEAVESGRGKSCQSPDIQPEDGAVILYTSGSTGFPKGVLQRHISLGQSLMNMMFLGMLVTELEGGPREYRGGAERETPMLTVPLFHATGLLGGLVLPIMLGQKVVMMYKWDSAKALRLIQDEHVTGLNSVPAILQDLLSHPDFDQYDTT